VQEVAFTLADAIAYVEAALAQGLGVDEFAPRLSFFLNAHSDLLEEVGKFRAARRLWARIMRERFKAQDPRSWMFRFHTQTAGSTLTAQQPDVNIVRVTLQALAAVLGGTQSLHTNSRDEALALPTEASALLALRTQQILAAESGVANTVDPLGGSYLIEKLTSEIEANAREYLRTIDAMGGMVRAIESGYVQREIQKSAYEYQQTIERGERVVVGVNRYQDQTGVSPPLLHINPETERTQVERLTSLRARRDAARAETALRAVEDTARSHRNLMPVILDAVKAYATVGEISDALRRVFGEYRESVMI
jgi:methylmalonyl-CoA mutase N-terminal domain/subunit